MSIDSGVNQMRSCGFLMLIAIWISIYSTTYGDHEHDKSRIIARVNGMAIVYSDIAIRSEGLQSVFEKRFGRKPMDSDREQLLTLQLDIENQRLRQLIKSRIRLQTLEQLGVLPSDEEISLRCEREWPPEFLKEMLDQARGGIEVVIKAYEAVMFDKRDPEEVYDAMLVGVMSREEWRLRVKHDMKEKSLRQLKGLLKGDVVDRFDCRTGMRMKIIMEREDAALDAEIARTDPEYAEYLHLAEVNPSDPKVQEKGPWYRDTRRYLWWEERMRSADVTILDPAYRDAWPVDKRND